LLQHFIESGPILSALSSRDTGIVEGGDDLPASRLGNLGELGDLIFQRLAVSGNAAVECSAFDTFCGIHN
jgi:hypothetical protein